MGPPRGEPRREVGPDEPERLARRFDEVTQTTVGPLYRATLEFDRHRLAEPGMPDKVITVGSAAPRYSAPGPARAELLAALVP